MVYGLTGRFVSLRSVLFGEGSVFFSLFLSLSLLVSTLLLFYATKEVLLFLTINLKSFISLDFRNIITKISPTFRQYNSGWTQFIKGGCIFFFCIDILILMYFQRDQV